MCLFYTGRMGKVNRRDEVSQTSWNAQWIRLFLVSVVSIVKTIVSIVVKKKWDAVMGVFAEQKGRSLKRCYECRPFACHLAKGLGNVCQYCHCFLSL